MFTSGDAPRFATYRSDPDVVRYQSWSIPYTVEQAAALIDAQAQLAGPTPGEWLQIAVERDGVLAGDVAVHLSADGRHAEVGCTLAADHQGHGYAREAVLALLALLHEVGVERVEAEIDPRNHPSIALFEAVGFVHQRTDLRAVEIRGEWCDSARYERRL